MNPFSFLASEFPEIHGEASKAVEAALGDPRTACFYARRAVEVAVKWAFTNDRALVMPYDSKVSTLLHDPGFKRLTGEQVFRFAKTVNRLGNRAVHETTTIGEHDSVTAVSALFEFCYWFARTYTWGEKPPAGLTFDPRKLPPPAPSLAKTRAAIRHLQGELEEAEQARAQAAEALADQAALEAELEQLRAEVAAAKARAAAVPDTHDYSEAETRDYFIDKLLAEAGWDLADERDREFAVTGMPAKAGGKDGVGYVDYVLWGDDGLPLALVEAKRTRRDARVGQQQAKLYADCLEAMFGRRPVVFYTNGYEHWLWDDQAYPPRQVQGFYAKDELELLMQRRTAKAVLADTEIESGIVERPYQVQAIRRVCEHFEVDRQRKALLVMATGAGKTRTVIALADLLIRANWAKRILFLADRTALVNQALNAFKRFLPDSSPVNLVSERSTDGRVYVSTYPTMMNLINAESQGQRRFGVGYFDLVVIDEAHRSVFKKYKAIFDHLDSFLVGLTATPRDEVDKNTYDLFELETGVPTAAYDLSQAVEDGYLVPPRAVSVPLKFQREGISYDDLTEAEKEEWDELDWDEDGDDAPDSIGAEAVNKWLFNADTVDKVLAQLMTAGVKVAGGDRLGKTIVFAKNQAHAEFVAERFDANYPQHRGSFARVVTHATEYAQSLIDDFSVKDKAPHVAISVDMLDTGIDVPEVVNLVFFKPVRSKTKFWQMLGRGTRLCPDLFGPDADKASFLVFDYCMNFEFFAQNPEIAEGGTPPSVGKRRFVARLDLLRLLQAGGEEPAVRHVLAEDLRREIEAMNLDNLVVRPHRRLIERFRGSAQWESIAIEDSSKLANDVAGLPTELPAEPEEAKRFDVLLLNLELTLLRGDAGFTRLRDQVMTIAGLIEEYPTIPAITKELELIAEVQTEQWWEDVTLPMLEAVRTRLRGLVQFIERRKRKVVYTDFADEIGDGVEVGLAGLAPASDFQQFVKKARHFLRQHQDTLAIDKVHRNRPLTPTDLEELERILLKSGIGDADDIARARSESGGFGLFVRSLVGLDRTAAKEAFGVFLDGALHSANQIEFIDLIIEDLTRNGVVEASRFYGAPFTDISPTGPEALFTNAEVDRLVEVLDAVRANAAVA